MYKNLFCEDHCGSVETNQVWQLEKIIGFCEDTNYGRKRFLVLFNDHQIIRKFCSYIRSLEFP